MATEHQFHALIDRIRVGSHTTEDLKELSAAFEAGSLRIDVAGGGVGIGGNANDAIIVTGSGNTISRGADTQTIIAALSQQFEALAAELLARALAGVASTGQAAHQRPVAPAPFMFPEARQAVGRAAQRGSLRNRLAEVASSQVGQVALITGKRGYGRSALARQFGQEDAAQIATVCYGQFFADMHQRDGFFAPNAAELFPLRERVEQRWPNATAIAGPVWVWMVAQIYRALNAEPTPADLRTPDNPSALRALLRQLKGPCVLVIERWEYASEEWLQLILELPKALLNERPLLLLLTLTLNQPFAQLTRAIIDQQPALQAVQTLRERAPTTPYWLGDLKVEDVAALIGPAASPELARQLHGWSGGQPALAEDVWATWIELGVVARDAAGAWEVIKPADIDGGLYDLFANLIKARLQADDAEDDFAIIETLLIHAAVEGVTCTAEVAATASSRYLDETLELWDTYLGPTPSEPGILQPVDTANPDVTHYQFSSLAARRAWKRLGADQGTVLRVAEALEAVYHGSSDAVAERLIALFESIGQAERAKPYYQRRQYAAAAGERLRWLLESARLTAQQPHEWQRVFKLELDLAWFYLQAGEYARAEQTARAALDEDYTPSKPERGRALNIIGLNLERQGKYGEAETVLREALSLIKLLFGPHHRSTLTTQANLAQVLEMQGAYAEARTIFEQVLEIQQRILGHAHPDTLITQHNLAQVLGTQGAYAEARTIFEQVLEIQQHTLGHAHPHTLSTQHNLAWVLRDQGAHTEARTIYEQVLEIKQRTLGHGHPSTLITQHDLAQVLRDQGAHAEARTRLEQVLEIQQRTLGDVHPHTLSTRHSLAKVLQDQGASAEARTIFEQVLEIQQRILGHAHPHTLITQHNLAQVLRDQGVHAEARTLFEQVLEIKQRTLGATHPSTLITQHSLAGVLRDQGAYAEARTLFAQVLTDRQRTLGATHPDTLTTQHSLALVLRDQGASAEAQELFQSTAAMYEATLGSEDPKTQRVKRDYSKLLQAIQAAGDERSDEAQAADE